MFLELIFTPIKMVKQLKSDKASLFPPATVRYLCDECDYSSPRTDTLRNHKSAKHNIGPKYFCNQCDFQATLPRQLKIHKQGKHEGLRYSCNHCEFKALRQDHLALHKQSKHEIN